MLPFVLPNKQLQQIINLSTVHQEFLHACQAPIQMTGPDPLSLALCGVVPSGPVAQGAGAERERERIHYLRTSYSIYG